jgi:putative ABC transport system ATP-binding protein
MAITAALAARNDGRVRATCYPDGGAGVILTRPAHLDLRIPMSSQEGHGFVLDGVTVIRGRARLLDWVSTHIKSGRCTAVIGHSGAGKSTLLRVLNRLQEPTTGRVLLDGAPIAETDVLALRRRVGLVAQRPVLLTARVTDETRVGRPDLPPHRVVELLQRVGLPAGFGDRRTAELSGGEAQRACLARALAVEPEVLLLDEPTSALDGPNAALITELARDHVTSGGTVVLASHDLAVVRSVADWVLVLDGGRLLVTGRPGEVDYLQARR